MSSDEPRRASTGTNGEAHHRLKAASTERSRLRDEHERAKGTAGELEAETSLRAADDELAARERWLQWVEERDF